MKGIKQLKLKDFLELLTWWVDSGNNAAEQCWEAAPICVGQLLSCVDCTWQPP
jgi:hypothetical protein